MITTLLGLLCTNLTESKPIKLQYLQNIAISLVQGHLSKYVLS